MDSDEFLNGFAIPYSLDSHMDTEMDGGIYTVQNTIHENLKQSHISEKVTPVTGIRPKDSFAANRPGIGNTDFTKILQNNLKANTSKQRQYEEAIRASINGTKMIEKKNPTVFAISSTILENKLSNNLHNEIIMKLQQHAIQSRNDTTLIHAWKLDRFIKLDDNGFIGNNTDKLSIDAVALGGFGDPTDSDSLSKPLGNTTMSVRSSYDAASEYNTEKLDPCSFNNDINATNIQKIFTDKKKGQRNQYVSSLDMQTQAFVPVKLDKTLLMEHKISQRDSRNLIIGTPMIEPRKKAILFSIFGLRCIITDSAFYILKIVKTDDNLKKNRVTEIAMQENPNKAVVSQANFDLSLLFIDSFSQILSEIMNTGIIFTGSGFKVSINNKTQIDPNMIFTSLNSKAAENSPWEIVLLECLMLFLTKQMQLRFTDLSQTATRLMSTLAENKQSAACIFNSVGMLESETTASRTALMSLLDCDRDVASLSFANQNEIAKMEKLQLLNYSSLSMLEPSFYINQNLPCPLSTLEDMIEAYTAQIYTVSHELKRIEHSLKQKLRHTQLSLDQKRNMMLRFGLMVEMYNVAITATAVINGCLGMNIDNPWQLKDDEYPNPDDINDWLPMVISMFLSFVVGIVTFLAFFLPARKKLIAKND